MIDLQNIDPDVFAQMQPFVQQAVLGFGGGRNITESDIDRMANEIVVGNLPRFRMPVGYNQNTLIEIARFLLLIALYNTYGYNLNPFWQLYFGGIPYFLLPFLVIGRSPFITIPWRPSRPRPPHGGGPSRPPHGGGPSRPPHGGGPSRPPHGGGPSRPPHGGGPSRPPHGGSPSRPPHGGSPSRPPHGGSPSRPPHGGGPSRPPHGGGPSRPPHGGGQSRPSRGGIS